jgi:8-oxo-dGTP diphosphatase
MLIDTGHCDLFCIYDFNDRIEYVYTKPASFRADEIDLQEGQALEWFSESDISRMQLAYGFNRVLQDFFQRRMT